jgi:flagellum-specific peptidoglycan hydrolase FlgJ
MAQRQHTIQIGNIERTDDRLPLIAFTIDSAQIARVLYRNWLNLALIFAASYLIWHWQTYFAAAPKTQTTATAMAETVAQKSNKNTKVETVKAAIGQAGAPDPSFHTEGVVEVLPQRAMKPVQSVSAKGGTEANLFDNVSIFVAPEKANAAVVKTKEEKCKDYIRRFINVAKAEREKFGIPVSITLAQGLLESDAGESRLTRSANNHFGIKTFNRRVPHVVLKDDSPTDKFKKYNTAWESYRDHSLLLMRAHYKNLQFLSKRDYAGWARGLEKAGYATDKMYAEKLIKIIENLKLYQFDEA